MSSIPIVYRCPVTPRDLARLAAGRVHLHLTIRRHPPHVAIVLVPRGRKAWPMSWPSFTARVFLEPSSLEWRPEDAL